MDKSKIKPLIRDGKPSKCIACGSELHRKSEYYCVASCEQDYRKLGNENAPPFLSKWKIRKLKEARDPLINFRKKTRRKSKELLKVGSIKKQPCVVCGSGEALMHHEDYNNPKKIIWLCEHHHKEYHDGKIGLFNNKLWWDPSRLVPMQYKEKLKTKKYAKLQSNHKCSKLNQQKA